MLKPTLVCTLLSWYCLTQLQAKPTSDFDLCQLKAKYGHLKPLEKDSSLSASRQLLKMILLSMENFSVSYLTKVKRISEEFLKDPTIKDNNSEKVKEFKQKIKDFEEKYTSCSDMKELFQLTHSYSVAKHEYYKMEENDEKLTDDKKIILEALKKHKIEELDKEFENKFLEFLINFTQKLEEVKDELEKKQLDDKTVKWWEEFEQAKKVEEKIEILMKNSNLL